MSDIKCADTTPLFMRTGVFDPHNPNGYCVYIWKTKPNKLNIEKIRFTERAVKPQDHVMLFIKKIL